MIVKKEILTKDIDLEDISNKVTDKEFKKSNKARNKDHCNVKNLKFNEDEIINEMLNNKDLSPFFDQDNDITVQVNQQLSRYLNSDEYYDEFLKYLCKKNNGKWILGGSFGKTANNFHRASKCSYKTKQDCDKSYNWKLIKGETDNEFDLAAKLQIPDQIEGLIKKANSFDKDVNKIVTSEEIKRFFNNSEAQNMVKKDWDNFKKIFEYYENRIIRKI